MAEQRRFPRFDVAEHPTLRGYIDLDRTPERLVTIGLGGCGFYGETTEDIATLSEGKPITCTFECKGILSRPISVPGNVAYAYSQKSQNQNIVFCGVEFVEAHQDKVKPIIDSLQGT